MNKDYAEIYVKLHQRLKDLHHRVLNQDHVEAYLISCDVTELAQELEDVMQAEANKVKQ